jgi:hypothetical protein
MSKQAVEQVVRKASTDARFRAQLAKDFKAAVKPFKLTAAEKIQLQKGAGIPETGQVPERQAARALGRVQARALPRAVPRTVTTRLATRVVPRTTEI